MEMHTGRSLPVSCELLFFKYFFIFSLSVPVLPGGGGALCATAQRVCLKSNGMLSG